MAMLYLYPNQLIRQINGALFVAHTGFATKPNQFVDLRRSWQIHPCESRLYVKSFILIRQFFAYKPKSTRTICGTVGWSQFEGMQRWRALHTFERVSHIGEMNGKHHLAVLS